MIWVAGATHLITTLAADPAPADVASNGPVVIVVLAALTLAGTLATAMAPTLLEMVKNRGKLPRSEMKPSDKPATPEATAVAHSATAGLSMVEEMVLDYRRQRDNAQARLDDAQADLADAQNVIRRQAVQIAELQNGRRRANRHDEYYSADYPPWGTQR